MCESDQTLRISVLGAFVDIIFSSTDEPMNNTLRLQRIQVKQSEASCIGWMESHPSFTLEFDVSL